MTTHYQHPYFPGGTMKWPFVLRRTHAALGDKLVAVAGAHAQLNLEHRALQQRYAKIEHGHEQGRLEGRRAAFVEVRAWLADDLFMNPKLRYLAPKLAALGKAEDDALAKMKGYGQYRDDMLADSPVQLFPTPAPQRAVEVPIEGLTQTRPVLPKSKSIEEK